ncbi:MAG: hypothetical protein LBJ67_08000 [Planctomycetaceae bacterium]|jgi:hypothetical protein|nr:hypothetical protein [Planctomycetaceae bacterium]
MKIKYLIIRFAASATAISFLPSCSPECQEKTIQKPEWTTRYVDYWIKKDTVENFSSYVDTLVSYSVTEHRTKKEYHKNSSGELVGATLTHYITIRNNNASFSNSFAIQYTAKEYNESSKKWKDINNRTNYVSISPRSSYTFSIKHSDWWRNESSGYSESNVSFSTLQNSITVYKTEQQVKRMKQKLTRRVDTLVLKDTIVNNCSCDIDALKAECKAIQDVFDKLKNEKLIKTE